MYVRFGTRQILFKLEATEGVDAGPTGAANALLTFNASLEIQVDTPARMPDKPYFSSEDKIEIAGRAKISFECDLLGALAVGTSSPIAPLLQAAGFAEVLAAPLAAPSGLAAAPVVGGGTFVAGPQFWKITGLNSVGETTGSVEATATIAANGSAALTWSALPAGTTNVKVYRGTATNAENALITTLGNVTAYTDTGTAGTPATPPAVSTAVAATQYTPVTIGIPSATFYFYQAGMLWQAQGARGDLIVERDPTNFAKATFTFLGKYNQAQPISQASIPAITVSQFRAAVPVVPANWVVTCNGYHVQCVKHQFKLNNTTNYVPASETASVLITDRKPDGTLSILLPDITQFNPWQLAYNRTLLPISDTVNGGPSLNSQINLPSVRLLLPKKSADNKGVMQIDVPYIAYPTNGNDECNFTFF